MTTKIPWLRVFVEGVVIVGSILLAFGIDAWWANRQDRGLERQYLARLSEDLELGTSQVDGQLERLGNAFDAARTLAPALDGSTEPITDDALVQHFAVAARTGFVEANLDHGSTYQELQATGRLALISDVEFRQALAAYYRQVERVTQSVLQLNQGTAVRFQQLTGRRAADVWRNLSVLSPQDRSRILQELRSNPEVVRDLRQFSAMVTLNLTNLRGLREQADTLLARSAQLLR